LSRILVYLGILLTGIAIGGFAVGIGMLVTNYADPGGAALTGTGAEVVQEVAEVESPGAVLYRTKTCLTCHGEQGNKPLLPDYPEIAGQNVPYLLQQMKDIKSGERANGQSIAMKGIMHLVNDEELVLLAEYINTLPPAPTAGADPESEGAKLFATKTCSACHGPDGKTPLLPEYPRIAGHSAEYALRQMKDIKSGARANGQTLAMKGVMHLVDDEQMQALAEYLSTMEP
jgi:cytochrome c553